MSDTSLKSMLYSRDLGLRVLDQLKLPATTEFIDVRNCEDGYSVIKNMNVRGAPAIAIVGCLSLAVEILSSKATLLKSIEVDDVRNIIKQRLERLVSSRPTAVNLANSAKHIRDVVEAHDSAESILDAVVDYAESMLAADIKDNQSIGHHGMKAIISLSGASGLSVLTHCNTGSLASGGYGTALGVVRALHARRALDTVYCTETRPYNQGARLTAFELMHDHIPATLICDSMAAALMAKKKLAAVVVGADRVARNGDTANKIGTYSLAVLAKHHGVPFFVAAPTSTLDMTCGDGSAITIEERPPHEMLECLCSRDEPKSIAPEGMSCWNPSFDVTPADLITGGIITEFGVIAPPLDTNENLIKTKLLNMK